MSLVFFTDKSGQILTGRITKKNFTYFNKDMRVSLRSQVFRLNSKNPLVKAIEKLFNVRAFPVKMLKKGYKFSKYDSSPKPFFYIDPNALNEVAFFASRKEALARFNVEKIQGRISELHKDLKRAKQIKSQIEYEKRRRAEKKKLILEAMEKVKAEKAGAV